MVANWLIATKWLLTGGEDVSAALGIGRATRPVHLNNTRHLNPYTTAQSQMAGTQRALTMRYQIVFYACNDLVAFESLSGSLEAYALLRDTTIGHMENGVRFTTVADADKLFVLIDALDLNALPMG